MKRISLVSVLLVILAGCSSSQFEPGQKVWVNSDIFVLNAYAGGYGYGYATGTVIEANDGLVQVQIEQANLLVKKGPNDLIQVGKTVYLPEKQLSAFAEGKKQHESQQIIWDTVRAIYFNNTKLTQTTLDKARNKADELGLKNAALLFEIYSPIKQIVTNEHAPFFDEKLSSILSKLQSNTSTFDQFKVLLKKFHGHMLNNTGVMTKPLGSRHLRSTIGNINSDNIASSFAAIHLARLHERYMTKAINTRSNINLESINEIKQDHDYYFNNIVFDKATISAKKEWQYLSNIISQHILAEFSKKFLAKKYANIEEAKTLLEQAKKVVLPTTEVLSTPIFTTSIEAKLMAQVKKTINAQLLKKASANALITRNKKLLANAKRVVSAFVTAVNKNNDSDAYKASGCGENNKGAYNGYRNRKAFGMNNFVKPQLLRVNRYSIESHHGADEWLWVGVKKTSAPMPDQLLFQKVKGTWRVCSKWWG